MLALASKMATGNLGLAWIRSRVPRGPDHGLPVGRGHGLGYLEGKAALAQPPRIWCSARTSAADRNPLTRST